MSASHILELAHSIQSHTKNFDTYLRQKNLPFPSFEEDGPQDLRAKSEEVKSARMAAITASLELYHLLIGPAMQLRPGVGLGQFLREICLFMTAEWLTAIYLEV